MPPYSAEAIKACLHFVRLDKHGQHGEEDDHHHHHQQQHQGTTESSAAAGSTTSTATSLWWPCLRCDNLEMVVDICDQVGYDLKDVITATIMNNKNSPVVMLFGQTVPNNSRYFLEERNKWTFQSFQNFSIGFFLTCMAQCENNLALRSAFSDLRETFVKTTSRSNNKHYLADDENSNPTKRLKPSIQDESKNAPTAAGAACAERDVQEVANYNSKNANGLAATINGIGAAASIPPAAATEQLQQHVKNAAPNEKKQAAVEPKTVVATDLQAAASQPAEKKRAVMLCDGCAAVELDSACCFRFRLDCGGKCWICPGCFSECQAARQSNPTFACPNPTCHQRLYSSWIVVYPDANPHLANSTEPSVHEQSNVAEEDQVRSLADADNGVAVSREKPPEDGEQSKDAEEDQVRFLEEKDNGVGVSQEKPPVDDGEQSNVEEEDQVRFWEEKDSGVGVSLKKPSEDGLQVDPIEKMVVRCSRGQTFESEPGNVAYLRELSKLRPSFRKANYQRKYAMVGKFLAKFSFVLEGEEMTEEKAEEKVFTALWGKKPPTTRTRAPPSQLRKSKRSTKTYHTRGEVTSSDAGERADAFALAEPGTSLVGKRIAREFGEEGFFFGTIKAFFPGGTVVNIDFDLWYVEYDDGDEEDYDIVEITSMLALYEKVSPSDDHAIWKLKIV